MPTMGFNPFRSQRKTTLDFALVIGTLLIAVALVAWAAFSG